jgi:hypothetical protein
MEPQHAFCEDEDESIPFGLRITIGPLPGEPLEGINTAPGMEPFPLPSNLPSNKHLGHVMVTPTARALLKDSEISLALSHHLREELQDGKPGRSCRSDPPALRGWRVRGVYRGSPGAFWIITEADRRRTSVLMPKDYQGPDPW